VAQLLNISINISPLHLVGAVFISQVLFNDKFTELVGGRLNEVIDTVYAAGKNAILESPVTLFAAGLTFAVYQLAPHCPALALSSEDAMKAAAFAGGVFALKSALSPLLEKATEHKGEVTHATLLRNTVVIHFFPLALGAAYAYYTQVPVKLAENALMTASLIPIIKLFGKGIDSFCEMDGVKQRIQECYAWMSLEKPQ
jgi:hypothetical protein